MLLTRIERQDGVNAPVSLDSFPSPNMTDRTRGIDLHHASARRESWHGVAVAARVAASAARVLEASAWETREKSYEPIQ